MNRLIGSLATLALVAGIAVQASAAEKAFSVTAGLSISQGDAAYMTRKPLGLGLDLGYTVTPQDWDGVAIRFHVGQVRFNGDRTFEPWVTNVDSSTGTTYEKMSYQQFLVIKGSVGTPTEQRFAYDMVGNHYGCDFIYPITVDGKKLSLFAGPDIHHWLVTRLYAGGNQKQGDQGGRLGWRLGFGYQITESLELSASYTATEWRSHSTSEVYYEQGANPSQPSYAMVSLGYKF